MTTVKEFKDLGVVFVDGDEGNHYKVGDEASFNSCKIWDDSTPLSFAWRPLHTLPENPKFKYEQDDDKGLWRPLLDQSSTETPEEKEVFDKMKPYEFDEHVSVAKPVFTQAMADKGECPRIGMMVKYPTGEGELALGADNNSVCIVIESGIYKRVSFIDLKPIDTRTPKQKAVCEMLSDSRCSGSVIEVALERLYDKGYRKC